jgi:hypothetical protein
MVQSGKGFRILSSTLYSDKAFAMIREILSNAFDAHNAIDKGDIPFHVHLPSKTEPFWAVRDFGPGLSDEDMGRIYTVYFESTKARHSKKFAGQLGLGTKAPLAFTESFVVVSFHNGKKRTYTIFFDSDDNPTLSPPLVTQTDEPNGIEVIVKVAPEDFKEVIDKTSKALSYYDPMPIITNAPANFRPGPPDAVFQGEDFALTMRGRGSLYGYTSNPARAVMGRVIYPIKADMVPGLTETQQMLLDQPFDIRFPMGTLDFVPSREELSYDRNITIPGIKKAVAKLERDIIEALTVKLAPAETEMKARQVFASLDEKVRTIAHKLGGVPWNGLNIAETFFPIKVPKGVTITSYEARSRGVSRDTKQAGMVACIPLTNTFVFDNDREKSSVHGMHAYCRDTLDRYSDRKGPYFLLEGDAKSRAAILKRIEGVDTGPTSKFIHEVARRSVSAKKVYNGKLDKDHMRDTYVNMELGGFYVLIVNNELSPAARYNKDQWESAHRAAVQAKLFDRNDQVVAVPASLSKQFVNHPKWKDFYFGMRERAIERINETKPEQGIANFNALSAVKFSDRDDYRNDATRVIEGLANVLGKDHPFAKFHKKIVATRDSAYGAVHDAKLLSHQFGIDLTLPKPNYDFAGVWSGLIKQYPMVTVLLDLGINMYDDDLVEKVMAKVREYVELVDGKKVVVLSPPIATKRADRIDKRRASGR